MKKLAAFAVTLSVGDAVNLALEKNISIERSEIIHNTADLCRGAVRQGR